VLVLGLSALTPVSARGISCRCLCNACCSSRSRARRSSHRARSASARARTSALCRRHSTTWASYPSLHASCSSTGTEMEAEGEDDKDGSAGVVAGAAGSEGGWASGGGDCDCDCGWEGETRGRSGGGTEKGSERAALVGRKVIRQGECIFGNGIVNAHLEKVLAMRAQRTCVMGRHKLGLAPEFQRRGLKRRHQIRTNTSGRAQLSRKPFCYASTVLAPAVVRLIGLANKWSPAGKMPQATNPWR
jgi:hypothetical protein